MASTEGGMDIEEVAEKTPEKIVKETIDPAVGMHAVSGAQDRRRARAQGRSRSPVGAKLITGVYKTWWECDASMVEINPLCIIDGADGKETLMAVDAKIGLDDNALYRHKNIQAMRDLDRGSAAGNRGQQVSAQLHQARRQHRLPRQRRGPGDGDDGHHPAFRRRARRTSSTWAAARARSR